jgi:hypothetical protein
VCVHNYTYSDLVVKTCDKLSHIIRVITKSYLFLLVFHTRDHYSIITYVCQVYATSNYIGIIGCMSFMLLCSQNGVAL